MKQQNFKAKKIKKGVQIDPPPPLEASRVKRMFSLDI